MTDFQKTVKYIAIGLAAFLAVSIIGGIASAVGFFGGFVFDDAVTEETEVYAVSSDIKSLCIDISAADLTIKNGDEFSVESNLKHLTVKDKNSILSVEESNKLFGNYNGSVLVITVPEGTVFEKVQLETGAGRLKAECLSAKVLDCDFGAGEIKIDSLVASSNADIDGGAGKITISDGKLSDLDFDMGVGQLNFTAVLTGECELDLGVGESNITLLGDKEEYTLDIEKGLGNITVDGDIISDVSGLGDGRNTVEISGGIGAVNVNFEEDKVK